METSAKTQIAQTPAGGPRVSVLMGVYYQRAEPELLERAVRSVLQQDFDDFELLICDDGSNEAAVLLLDRLAIGDHRLRLLRPGNKFTLPEKLNYMLMQAKGELIARMDDDDFSHPNRFSEQVKYLDSHPETAFVGCSVNLVSADGRQIPRHFPERPTPMDFRFSMPYVHPALMFRRKAMEQVGGYSTKPYCILCEDYDLLLRMYEQKLYGANQPEILFDYSIENIEQNRRPVRARMNEVIVRFLRFRANKILLKSWLYVFKPLIVGLLPLPVVNALRQKRLDKQREYLPEGAHQRDS